jgi:molybdopterin molybdotransferase
MAQLTDDCFAFSGPLLPVHDMERLIVERVSPVQETETVPLAAARGRVLAADAIAPLDLPPFDNSAVDGYAVRHCDLAANADTRLAISGRLTAGAATSWPLGPGEAIRIFTGAPMPAGANTVFMQEDVQLEGQTVIVPAGLKPGANRRLAGEDVRKGAAASVSRCSRPATKSSSRAHRDLPQRSTTPTATCCAACWNDSVPTSLTLAFSRTTRRHSKKR